MEKRCSGVLLFALPRGFLFLFALPTGFSLALSSLFLCLILAPHLLARATQAYRRSQGGVFSNACLELLDRCVGLIALGGTMVGTDRLDVPAIDTFGH